MKKILKAIDVALSMYSKIPMPRFNWASEDMKYHLCFFPWVGAVIGIVEMLFFYFCMKMGVDTIFKAAVAMAIPLLITGGFHVDGFMDTMDAIHSYQPKEKKLEILKDPHIGAFSVICLLTYMLIAIGCLTMINNEQAALILSAGFFMARAFSGLSLMFFKNAKDTGMLNTSTVTADKKIVRLALIIQIIICAGYMLWVDIVMGALSIVAFAASYFYYYKMSYKQFGGITGDLAGYFVCLSELVSLLAITVYRFL